MIPDGTSPEAIVVTIAFTLFVFGLLAMWLFWYRIPNGIRNIPARIMSRALSERTAPATSTAVGTTSTNQPHLPDTYQVIPSAPPQIEPEPNGHNYTRSGLIALLSVQKNETGTYRWTANQIAAFIGGTRAEVLKEIAQYRPTQSAAAQVKRPANGWGDRPPFDGLTTR